MWRRLLWWSSERPAALPWAVLLSLLLVLSGQQSRLAISGTVVRFVYAPFFALRYRIAAGADVFQENRRLVERVASLQIENQRLQEAYRENDRLRRLIGFAPAWEGLVIPAEVIGPLSPGTGTLWVGAGAERGVRANWPIVSEDGLLGRVVEVSADISRVRTIWDRLLRVAAYDQRSRVGGVMRWLSGPSIRMEYVSRASDVQVGDTILSSGWGDVFPKGLRIGTVTAVDTLEDSEFLDIIVLPAAHPDRLEAVFVVEPVAGDSTETVLGVPNDGGGIPGGTVR